MLESQRHLLDDIIVRLRDRQDIRVTKAMCGAECWTDHRLMICKLSPRPTHFYHGRRWDAHSWLRPHSEKMCWVLRRTVKIESFSREKTHMMIQQRSLLLTHHPHYHHKVETSVKRIKCNKAPEEDNITGDIIQDGGEAKIQVLTDLCNKCLHHRSSAVQAVHNSIIQV